MFKALYQQDPAPAGDLTFQVGKLVTLPVAPAVWRTVRAWDLAATMASPGRDPDWTVGLKLGLMEDGRKVILDVVRFRAGPAEVERVLQETARKDGLATTIALAQDPGQAGVAQIAYLKRGLGGYPVVSSPETGAKETRAMPAAATMEKGDLIVLQAPWTRALIDELSTFPQGEKDDQVDALARAMTVIDKLPAVSRSVPVTLMGR